MNLTTLLISIFLVSLGIFLLLLYLFVVAPAAKRKLRERLDAIEEAGLAPAGDRYSDLLRQEILSTLPEINQLLGRIKALAQLSLLLRQAAIKITVSALILICFSAALILGSIGLLFRLPLWFSTFIAACGAAIPLLIIFLKRKRRFARFEEQFPDAISFLARAVRAGHAFTTGFELISNEMAEPLAGEFRRVYEQQNLGMPLSDALQNLIVRVPLPDVHVFVTALIIQREAGGNLAEILDNLAAVIRERFKLKRQIDVFTAQARISIIVLTALPPAAGLAFYLVNPAYISRLFTDPLGHKMLFAAVILQLIGFLIIRKIIQPKA
jgi:tight adherence protein B